MHLLVRSYGGLPCLTIVASQPGCQLSFFSKTAAEATDVRLHGQDVRSQGSARRRPPLLSYHRLYVGFYLLKFSITSRQATASALPLPLSLPLPLFSWPCPSPVCLCLFSPRAFCEPNLARQAYFPGSSPCQGPKTRESCPRPCPRQQAQDARRGMKGVGFVCLLAVNDHIVWGTYSISSGKGFAVHTLHTRKKYQLGLKRTT